MSEIPETERTLPESRRMTELVAVMVENALDRLSEGDAITFDLALGQSPQGPVLVAAFWMPSGIIDQYVSFVSFWQPVNHKQIGVDNSVRESIEALRRGRSEILADPQMAAPGNGGPVPSGEPGLLPGSPLPPMGGPFFPPTA